MRIDFIISCAGLSIETGLLTKKSAQISNKSAHNQLKTDWLLGIG
jgi:hypothetical protein